jgi:hypothetical protein
MVVRRLSSLGTALHRSSRCDIPAGYCRSLLALTDV